MTSAVASSITGCMTGSMTGPIFAWVLACAAIALTMIVSGESAASTADDSSAATDAAPDPAADAAPDPAADASPDPAPDAASATTDPATDAANVSTEKPRAYTRNVAICIWNGAEILDWTGPAEVFAASGGIGSRGGERAFNVYTVSKTREPIVSQGFIDVIPDYSIADAPRPDLVVFPGGGGGSVLNDPEFFAWASRVATDAEVALSVCTGAFILGKAGLLDEKSATTWYGAIDGLERQFPRTRVLRGPRFVDNGQVVTTAGVSAGIDGSLHVVARLLGRHVADKTAEYMEYHWTPDAYLGKNYSVLNPSLDARGQRVQLAAIFTQEQNYDGAIQVCEELLEQFPDDATVQMQLGDTYYAGKRYDDAVRAYTQAARTAEVAGQAWYNAACCAALAGCRESALEYLTKAFGAGFSNASQARSDSDLAVIRDDPRFEAALAGTRR